MLFACGLTALPGRGIMDNKTLYRLYLIITGIILLLFTLSGSLAAGFIPGFSDLYSHTIYAFLTGTFGRLIGLLPFSLSECLLYILILYLSSSLLLCVIKPFLSLLLRYLEKMDDANEKDTSDDADENDKVEHGHEDRYRYSKGLRTVLQICPGFPDFLPILFFLVCLLLFLYMFQCGINYRRSSFAEESGIQIQRHSIEDLESLCRYLAERVNETEQLTGRKGQTESTPPPVFRFLRLAGKEGQASMRRLGEEYPGLSGSYPYPKPLLNPRLLTVQKLTGVYSPFTLEANYNSEIPYYNIPFTICHELSHLRGYMQEEEANFIAFLACIGSSEPYFNYSGYLSAWVYCGNALAAQDYDAFASIYTTLNRRSMQDLDFNREFWKKYDGKLAETTDQVNDAYLKANGQEQGVRSYGMVTDLILEYYLAGMF